jgi:glycosyltransferase involved in cell wall biosynthesis
VLHRSVTKARSYGSSAALINLILITDENPIVKILIISFNYFPSVNPRAFRWTALAEHWIKAGHHVAVVCNRTSGLKEFENINGADVHRVGGSIVERTKTLMHPLGERSAGRSEAAPVPGNPAGGKSFLLDIAKKVYDNTWKKVYWPDYACLWYSPASKQATSLLEKQRYEAMISVSLPFTGHIVGLRAHKIQPDVKWIVDAGDPFCYLEDTPTNNHFLYRKLNYSVERLIFRKCHAVAVTTEPTLTTYAELFPESAEKIHVIPPLMSRPEGDAIAKPLWQGKDKIRLLYVGTLYHGIRNPGFLLMLFQNILGTHLSDRIELHFAGRLHDSEQYFEPYRSLIGSRIFLHGLVDHTTAHRAMKDADILVNIGNNTPYQLPSKIVEYAAAGKPMLNLIKSEKDSSVSFLRPHPSSLSLFEDASSLTPQKLQEISAFIENPRSIDASDIDEWLSFFRVPAIASSYEALFTDIG